MWKLKFLSGPKAGKSVFLSKGLITLGRKKNSTIFIPSSSVSKEHAQIIVKENSLEIKDLNSSNGTFIDGKQIDTASLKDGDRVIFSSDIIFEIQKKEMSLQQQESLPLSFSKSVAPSLSKERKEKISLLENILKITKKYINETVLPGVYQLAEWIEFKFLIACFLGAFVVMVVSISSLPLISILRAGVEQESLTNVETIAETLAQINLSHLKKGMSSSLNVDYALRRPGVEKAFIISATDGRILAPSESSHTYPKESFVHTARKRDQKTVQKINASSVSAVVPISIYNPDTGQNVPKAYSVVIYKMDSLSSGLKKVFSLVVQSSLIALFLGGFLYFLLINLVEFPIRNINYQLERALKEDQAPSIRTGYQSQVLLDLCSHVNSALNQISLNKMLQAQKEDISSSIDRQKEISHLVEIIGFPALAIHLKDRTLFAVNANFTEQIGLDNILHQSIEDISNLDFQEHLSQLIAQGENNFPELSLSEFIFNEMKIESVCQIISGDSSPDYALISFMPSESNEEVA